MPIRAKFNRDEQGFVLITSLMVIFLVVTIVTTVALVTASDLRSAARARAVIETRLMAESVSDAVFASIAGEKFNIYDKAVLNFRSDPGVFAVDPTRNPLDAANPGEFGLWFALKTDGTLERCTTVALVRETCFRARLTQDTSDVSRSQQITLDIVARGGCIVQDPDAPTSCVFREFQQVFRTRSFIENVTLTESESPDTSVPELASAPVDTSGTPFRVAYIGSDQLDGNIRTNDTSFLRCGTIVKNSSNPELRFSSDNGSSDELPSVSTDCVGSELPDISSDPLDKFLPAQVDKSGASSVLQSNNVFSALAGGTPTLTGPYSLISPVASPVTIELNFGSLEINGIPRPYPSNGVIFVQGNLTILESSYSRSLSIVATGDITIDGNITLTRSAGPPAIVLNGATAATSPGETDPILGISSANGDIRLKCRVGSGECDERYIVGILSAREGTIFNVEWNEETTLIAAPDNPPRIHIFGALIAKNRPIFGAYTSISDSKTNFGWAKSLRFDPRLRYFQPPYFFRTTQASVVRSSLEISRCNESFCL